MNYLAHAYLSFRHPEILVGNLISDFVKGKQKLAFPAGIQQGITLHREIDAFTDSHPVTRQAKMLFQPVYRLYAGALMDIVYDHFLANDTQEFPAVSTPPDAQPAPTTNGTQLSLAPFAAETYETLAGYTSLFPERFARMFPYMRSQNWLFNYRFRWGIHNSFKGLSMRATWMPGPESAVETFETHYEELQSSYAAFFPELKEFVLSRFP